MRRPVVHKIFDLKKELISQTFYGYSRRFFISNKSTSIENLFVVTSGVIPPNFPGITVSVNGKSDNELENEWDITLFDSPPLVAVTDATMVTWQLTKL